MQVNNLKKVSAQLAYRTESITFAQDGGCHVSIQIGVLSGPDESRQFEPITSQGHYLSAEEMQGVKIEFVDGEPLRDAVEAALEQKLREKGAMKI